MIHCSTCYGIGCTGTGFTGHCLVCNCFRSPQTSGDSSGDFADGLGILFLIALVIGFAGPLFSVVLTVLGVLSLPIILPIMIAKDASPHLFNLSTQLLKSSYTWLVMTPFQGGMHVFNYVTTIAHAYLPSYSSLLGIIAVCCYICVLIAFLVILSEELGKKLGLENFTVLAGIALAPLAIYVVSILALDVVFLGQNIFSVHHNTPRETRTIAPETKAKFAQIIERINKEQALEKNP